MTNTPTLGLTQYAGTDTMNFITQYNADMTKIDDSAKISKAIGSDYIYSYTTPPSYSGRTVTLYSGTKYIPAYGRDANIDIKQTIYTCSTNKTISLTGTNDYDIYIDETQTLSSVLTSNFSIVSFVSNLPTTVATTGTYVYYVINEHRYYYTSGSTTASWSAKIYCKIASVRVASSIIQSFKPNLQLNLAQKIGKDKLLFTMSEVNANTDKEFVPSAVAVKELGVDYIVERGSNANGNYEKWHSGKLVMWGKKDIASIPTTTQLGTSGLYYSIGTYDFPIVSATQTIVTLSAGSIDGLFCSTYTSENFTSKFGVIYFRPSSTSTSGRLNWQAVGTYIVG